MTRVLADHHYATVATNDLALVTDLLDAWVYLHVFLSGLFVAINDSSAAEIVGAELHDHTVFWQDFDVVLTHLS